MNGTLILALMATICAARRDAESSEPASPLRRLDIALSLHPYTREALYTLETYNASTSPPPEARVEPDAVLGAFREMLGRLFRSVTFVETPEQAAAGRFHLLYDLDLHLVIGLISGEMTEVHAAAHIHRPDGAKVEYVNVDGARRVPYPARGSMIWEAVLEARDRTQAALLASPRLAAFALSGERRTAFASKDDGPLAAALAASSGTVRSAPPPAPAAPRRPPPSREIEWVRLPAGEFLMGSRRDGEKPVHRVRVKAFELARSEVTFGQYRACVAAGACTPPHADDGTCYQRTGASWRYGTLPAEFQDDARPVVCVDWHQARAFARWAGGRLPSEAEWEYAARGAEGTREYPWGDAEPDCSRAVFFDGADGCGSHSTWPVCSKPAGDTPQGLCDMAGNAFEWVEDRDHASYEGAPADGAAWTDGESSTRVRRGGSWATGPSGLRAAFRLRDRPRFSFASVGLRVARDAKGVDTWGLIPGVNQGQRPTELFKE